MICSCKVQKPAVTALDRDIVVVADKNGQWLSDTDENQIIEKQIREDQMCFLVTMFLLMIKM